MNKARKFLYSIPLALVGLATLVVALPVSAVDTTGTVAVSKNWVSKNPAAAAGSDTVTITVTDPDALPINTGGVDTFNLNVRSTTDGVGPSVLMTETGAATNIFTGTIKVAGCTGTAGVVMASGPDCITGGAGAADDGTAPATSQISVNNADTVTVRYTDPDAQFSDGLLVTKTFTVDNIVPVVSSFTPATSTVFGGTSVSVTLSIVATDDRSGFIPDDAATTPLNEAIPNATFTVNATTGLAAGAAATDAAGALTISYTNTFGAGAYTWNVALKDRAGNPAVIDTDAVTVGVQAPAFTVDATAPVLASARTGEAIDTVNNKIVSNKKVVRVVLTENDRLDSATVDASDFSVAGATVSSASVGTTTNALELDGVTTTNIRNTVFLTLAADLAPDAKPQVSLVGTVRDRAGNSAGVASVTAADGIKPTLTVTVVGDIDTRPAAKDTLTITVVSDENLVSAPNVTLGRPTLASTTNTTANRLDIVDVLGPSSAGAVSGATRTWSIQFTRATFGSVGTANVRVAATDTATNTATAGVTGTGVDISKAILAEFDNVLNGGAAPVFTLNPIVAVATDTDSSMPFIQVSYAGEGTEGPFACPGGGAGVACLVAATDSSIGAGEYSAGTNSSLSSVGADTHSKVTITTATFGVTGTTLVDVSANIQATGNNGFIFQPATALTVGTNYTLSLIAKDEIGNTVTTAHTFAYNVVAPKEFSLNLVPGWNLISLPENPAKPALNDVFGALAGVKQVLTYDANDPSGPWLVAQRPAAGGNLGTAQIVNVDTNHAYWVEVTKFETLKVTLPRRSASSTGSGLQPPQVMVKTGWNLVSVTDTTIPAVHTVKDADVQFGTVDWSFAYTFDTATGAWRRVSKSAATVAALTTDTDAVLVGKGYWLYANKDGLLVP